MLCTLRSCHSQEGVAHEEHILFIGTVVLAGNPLNITMYEEENVSNPIIDENVLKEMQEFPDKKHKVLVVFSTKPMAADMRNHHQRAQMRIDQNKKASYWMEGKEVGRAKLQAAQQKTNGLIKLRQKRCQIFRKENMINVIASLHLDMDILNEDILKGNRESILLNLTNVQIEKLVAQKSLNVSKITKPFKWVQSSIATPEDTAKAVYVDPIAFENDDSGMGVSVYLADFACRTLSSIGGIDYTLIGSHSDTINNPFHILYIGEIIHTLAPNAELLCNVLDEGTYKDTYADDETLRTYPNVRIQSISLNNPVADYKYTAQEQKFDDYTYEFGHRLQTLFISAGNVFYVYAPVLAYNVISVGSYQGSKYDNADYSNPPQFILATEQYTGFRIPGNVGQKPEMVAPGVEIESPTHHDSDSGSSFAAPHAAAIAADRLSGSTFLKDAGSPTVKAMMLATATQRVTNSDQAESEGYNGVGVGGVSYHSDLRLLAYWWDQDGNRPLDHNGACRRDWEIYLHTGEKVRVAISWLLRGDYQLAHASSYYSIGMDLDLYAYDPDGNEVAFSESGREAYDMVDFEANKNGQYEKKVCRYSKNDSDLRFDLGLAAAVYY